MLHEEEERAEVATASSPSLALLTDQEVLSLAEGLGRLIEKAPRCALDPTTITLARLCVSYFANRPDVANDLEQELRSAETRIEGLDRWSKGRITELEQRIESLLARPQPAPVKDEAEVERLKSEKTALVQEREGLVGKLAEVTALLGASKEELARKQEEIGILQEQKDRTNSHHATMKGEVKAFHEALKRAEWAGSHPTIKWRGSGKAISCCPVCEGLCPEGLPADDDDAGHRRNCWFRAILDAHKALLGRLR